MFKSIRYDRITLLLLSLIFGIGLIVMYSASTLQNEDPTFFLKKHAFNSLIAIASMIFFAHLPHKYLSTARYFILGLVILMLLISFQFTRAHTSRWIYLFGFSIQTSDFAKIGLLIFVSDHISRYFERSEKEPYLNVYLYLTISFVLLLILIQPDLSTTVVITIIILSLCLLGNHKIQHLAYLGSFYLFGGGVYIVNNSYMLKRLTSHFDANADKTNEAWQATQSLLTLANGSLFGVGAGNSVAKNFFLPQPHTDYIFSVLGEEYGFVGASITMLLFLLLFLRGLKIARDSSNQFSMLLATGISVSIFIYAIFHIMVVTGLGPVTGLPLPFISYGGSSLISNFIMMGILFNIANQNGYGQTFGNTK